MASKHGLLRRTTARLAGSLLTLAVLGSGISFTYAAFRSPKRLTRYQGIIEQAKIVGKGRKWFVLTLRGLPFGLTTFHADQDYRTLVANLAPSDTIVAYYNGPYPAHGSPTATISTAREEVLQLTKRHQDLISLSDKRTKDGTLGIVSLLTGLGMAWGTKRAFQKDRQT